MSDESQQGTFVDHQGGVVDLGALKDFKEKIKNARENILRQNGLMCPCGELIRDEGVTLFVYKEDIVPHQGSMTPAVLVGTLTFHSRECIKLLESLQMEDPKPIAIRESPRTAWLIEGVFADDDENNGDRPE